MARRALANAVQDPQELARLKAALYQLWNEPQRAIDLTPGQWNALRLRARGGTYTAIGRALGHDRHTIARWMQLPDAHAATTIVVDELMEKWDAEREEARKRKAERRK